MPRTDSGAKNTNVMTVLYRTLNLYASKIQVTEKVMEG